MTIDDMPTLEEVVAESLRDPEYRAEYERTRFAHEVALRVLQYRVEHNLTQTALAKQLGMRQPHIARLEAGDHEPSIATLRRLSSILGITFHIDITPEEVNLTA